MPVRLYTDVHVPQAIIDQLRRRAVDVVSTHDDDADELDDDELLERAKVLGRVLFTQDVRFRAMAEDWQRAGRGFAGLVFGPQLGATIGQYVNDLELIAKSTDPRSGRTWSSGCRFDAARPERPADASSTVASLRVAVLFHYKV